MKLAALALLLCGLSAIAQTQQPKKPSPAAPSAFPFIRHSAAATAAFA
jgi:hypothetical protein